MAESKKQSAMEYSKCDSNFNVKVNTVIEAMESTVESLIDDTSHNFTANLNTVIEALELHPDFITYLLNARRTKENQKKISSDFVVGTAAGLRFLVFIKTYRKHPVTANIQSAPLVGLKTSIDLAAAIKFAIDSMEQVIGLSLEEHKMQEASQLSSKLLSDLEGLSVSETVAQRQEQTKQQEKTKIVSQEPTLSTVVETDETTSSSKKLPSTPKSTSSESGQTPFSLKSEPTSMPKTSSSKHYKVKYTPPPKDYNMCMTTFDGAKGNDAHGFISSLEAYKDWGQISDEQTYNELHRLLRKNALAWWEKHKHIGYINTWEEAKKEMRIMFTEWPPHRVFKQILKMKQGNQPSIHYYRRIETLLEKLPEGYISEAAKIDLVYCQANDKFRMRVPRCIINNVKDFGIHGYGIENYNSLGIIRREEDFLYMKSTEGDKVADLYL